MSQMERHFIHLLYPGLIVSDAGKAAVDSWDIHAGERLARENGRAFGFYFSTRARGEKDLDSEEVARSGYYYIDATVETLEQVIAKNDPHEEILRSNMEINRISRVVRTNRGQTMQFNDNDTVLGNPKTPTV